MNKGSPKQPKKASENRLPLPCAQCGFGNNPPQAKFCGECGAPLWPSLSPHPELRPLTVLFCDLVDSTSLVEQKDPEEWRTLLFAYQACCRRIIHHFGGTIAQFLGDGVLAYFGYPQAYEHDAQRAVDAALCLIEEVGATAPPGEALQLRIGIHTGPVIIGAGQAAGYLTAQAVGDTPHVAARLQVAARPNTVLLSPTTARQVRDFFELEKLNPRRLKGFSRETAVYRARRPGPSSHVGKAAAPFGLVPLIGRYLELEQGRRQWQRARTAGQRLGLQIVGEPGIGKSRLINVLKEEVSPTGEAVLECRCSPYYQYSALHPLIDLLQRTFKFKRTESRKTTHTKLKHGIAAFGLPVREALPVLGRLLNVAGRRDPFPTSTPQKARERVFETLSALLTARAAHGPTLLIIEDLQWADPSTLELIEKHIAIQGDTPLLWVLSHRSDFEIPWKLPAGTVRLTLGRLTEAQSETLSTGLAGKKLPYAVLQHLIMHTDGVPLFLEELTQAVLESEALQEKADRYELAGPLPPALIPQTLFDSLRPRFDRLGDAFPVVQVAAACGREFSYPLLEAVAHRPWAELRYALETLQAAQLLFSVGDFPEAIYTFKHALIRDAAYHSLLKSQRQSIHGRIARALEKKFPDIAARQPELLAYHSQEAARYGPAIDYWQYAGQRALEHSASHEAIDHFRQGLALLSMLSDTAERQHKELLLQSALGVPLIMTQGYGAPAVEIAYARALELSQTEVVLRQRFTALRGLWVFYLVRAEYRKALKLGKQLLLIAKSERDPALRMEAHMAVGIPSFYCSEVTRARTHLGKALALYEPQQHRLHAFLYGQDPGVVCGGFDAWALLLLGYPEQAKKTMARTVRLAKKQAHPFSLAYALHFDAKIHQICREPHLTEKTAHAQQILSKEQGFPLFLGGGMAFQGWAQVEKSNGHEGVARMEQGIALWRSTGAEVSRIYWSALLAEAYGMIGKATRGLAILAEAFPTMYKNEAFFYEVELYRIQGELLLSSKDSAFEAEDCFQQAITIARRQNTKLLELRAVTCLSRLWQKSGKRQAARQRLEEIYAWFTEGFGTVDLKKAKALLSKLN